MCCSAHSHTHTFFYIYSYFFCARAHSTHKSNTSIRPYVRSCAARARARDREPDPEARREAPLSRDLSHTHRTQKQEEHFLSHRRQRIMSSIYNINIYSVNTRAAARARNPERTLHAHAPLRLTHSRHAAALRPRLSPIAGKRSCAGRPFAFFGARAGLPAAAAAAVGMAPMRAEGSSP